MLDLLPLHSWLSRTLFIPWVIHGPWTARRRQLRAGLVEARAGFRNWASSEPDARRRWVLAELRTIVRWAGERVPYYRALFKNVGFDPRADFSFSDYRLLPLLGKDTVRERAGDLIADGFSRNDMVAGATGGSTGVPVHFWLDQRSRAWSDISVEWAFGRIGFRAGDRLGLIWGVNLEPQMQETFKARVISWLVHQQPNDCFRLSDEVLDRIHLRLTRYRPHFLRCYASALALLAKRLDELGQRPAYPKGGIITGAEKLDAFQLRMIQSVFAAPLYQSYGSRDCGLMAAQAASADPRLYVAGANVLLEPYGPPDPLLGSEVVATLLHRQGMPFLRYRLGDYAHFPPDAREQPAAFLEEVTGRVLDHIRLPDGKLVHSTQFPHFFKDFDIREYQVVQEANAEVRVCLVAGPNLSSDNLARIQRVLCDNLHNLSLSLSLVPNIERSGAAKLRPVISRFHPVTSSTE